MTTNCEKCGGLGAITDYRDGLVACPACRQALHIIPAPTVSPAHLAAAQAPQAVNAMDEDWPPALLGILQQEKRRLLDNVMFGKDFGKIKLPSDTFKLPARELVMDKALSERNRIIALLQSLKPRHRTSMAERIRSDTIDEAIAAITAPTQVKAECVGIVKVAG